MRDQYQTSELLTGMLGATRVPRGRTGRAGDRDERRPCTGYACADYVGHDGLRAWTRGLPALIAYWSGRLEDSVRYAQSGTKAAARSRGTAGVWLASNEARALAALHRLDDAHAVLARAADVRDRVQPDELDSLGGLCTFSQPRQLYYTADALAWGGQPEADHTERLALDALEAYAGAPVQDRAFGGVAGTRSALAVAWVFQGEIGGAAEALAALVPVLKLPVTQRIHGVVTSMEHVRTALRSVETSAGRPLSWPAPSRAGQPSV